MLAETAEERPAVLQRARNTVCRREPCFAPNLELLLTAGTFTTAMHVLQRCEVEETLLDEIEDPNEHEKDLVQVPAH